MNYQLPIFISIVAILLLYIYYFFNIEHFDSSTSSSSDVSTNIQSTINDLQAKIGAVNDTATQIKNLIIGIQGIPLQNNINDLQSGKALTPVQTQSVVNNIMSVQNNINNLANTNTTLSSNTTDLNNLVAKIKSAVGSS